MHRQSAVHWCHCSTAVGLHKTFTTVGQLRQNGTLCREYRIPIKAALNGTAGVHSLKVVISPAATVANQNAADYKYDVPGLTQPGAMLCRNVPPLLNDELHQTL